MSIAREHGAWVNERCSLHIHMMSQYVPKDGKHLKGQRANLIYNSLERPIPEEIGINFHQLFRRFEHCLIWMFSAGNSLASLTRWEKFRQPVLEIASPVIIGMPNLSASISQFCFNKVRKEKYATINYWYSQFNIDNDFNIFHVEIRLSDGLLCPAAAASLACLIYALLLKAVDISRYGILSVGSNDTIVKIQEMRKTLLNNNRDYNAPRFSDTSNIIQYIPEFQEQSIEFIQFLESYLKNMGNSYEILLQLAERPISFRLAEDNMSWDEINKTIDSDFKRYKPENDIVDDILLAIDLGHVLDSESKDHWIEEMATIYDKDSLLIKSMIASMTRENIITWSNKTNSFIRT